MARYACGPPANPCHHSIFMYRGKFWSGLHYNIAQQCACRNPTNQGTTEPDAMLGGSNQTARSRVRHNTGLHARLPLLPALVAGQQTRSSRTVTRGQLVQFAIVIVLFWTAARSFLKRGSSSPDDRQAGADVKLAGEQQKGWAGHAACGCESYDWAMPARRPCCSYRALAALVRQACRSRPQPAAAGGCRLAMYSSMTV